jgi:flagellar biogenesis protein FliO
MMWGNGYNMAWGWPVGLLMLVAIVLLVIWAVRAFAGGTDRGGQRGDAAVAQGKESGVKHVRSLMIASRRANWMQRNTGNG